MSNVSILQTIRFVLDNDFGRQTLAVRDRGG